MIRLNFFFLAQTHTQELSTHYMVICNYRYLYIFMGVPYHNIRQALVLSDTAV